MPIPVDCPICGTRLRAPDAAAGLQLSCPKCNAPVQIPLTGGSEAASSPARREVPRNPDMPSNRPVFNERTADSQHGSKQPAPRDTQRPAHQSAPPQRELRHLPPPPRRDPAGGGCLIVLAVLFVLIAVAGVLWLMLHRSQG